MYSTRLAVHTTSQASGRLYAVQAVRTITKNGYSLTSSSISPSCKATIYTLVAKSKGTNYVTRTHTCGFHTTSNLRIKEFFPEPDAPTIKKTPAAWSHPVYTEEQMNSVTIAHRETRNLSDKVALFAVRVLRTGLDLVSGYRHDKAVALGKKDPAEAHIKYGMTERKYLIRNIFLESVAGVPGMVAGMLRHLHSMRRMKRDNGWIETLLEESYNERMHLLIFLKMGSPGPFMRLAVLGAQGVFFNAMFIAYLMSPRTVHRFVGYLEEEAVLTYTREIADLDAGKLPKWSKMQAPDIAVDYYHLPEGKRSMRDLLLHIRADEAKHREVNHTLGNLKQQDDPNPFVSVFENDVAPHPGKGIQFLRASGWEREEVIGKKGRDSDDKKEVKAN